MLQGERGKRKKLLSIRSFVSLLNIELQKVELSSAAGGCEAEELKML